MEALVMLAWGEAPDVIVCDIGMEPMNGLEFAVRLRDQESKGKSGLRSCF